jgi:small-conductance mechanosensitive channel
VRASILLWSTASGIILGLFIDATLIGVALLLSAVFPGVSARWHHRWLTLTVVVILAAIPVVMALLGYLEGELKAV